MNKKITTIFSVLIILVFIGYIIFDTASPRKSDPNQDISEEMASPPDAWTLAEELTIEEGSLKAVSVSPDGSIYLGGDSFISCYNRDLNLEWSIETRSPITSLSNFGDTIFASTMEIIILINKTGKIIDEWGPFEDDGIITSVASNLTSVVFADAGNKMVFSLDKNGVVKSLIGLSGEQFIIPSPYFDVALDNENNLYVANTGHRRVETRTMDGDLINYFGEAGMAPEAFCGCCNPAHFIIIPDGFVTAEKGINRIKILTKTGEFIEYVSSKNKFMASVPLDLASPDGNTIYAANPSDSKLYIFTRK
jgi:hypothetical protein